MRLGQSLPDFTEKGPSSGWLEIGLEDRPRCLPRSDGGGGEPPAGSTPTQRTMENERARKGVEKSEKGNKRGEDRKK